MEIHNVSCRNASDSTAHVTGGQANAIARTHPRKGSDGLDWGVDWLNFTMVLLSSAATITAVPEVDVRLIDRSIEW